MANVIIKCCAYETSRPLPNLKVTWYITSELVIPESFKNPKNWETFRKVNWKGLNLTRLGSNITDETGTSSLDYSLNKDKQDQHLWYIIQLPEVVGNISSGRIIHVGSEIIANPSTHEDLQIQFPKHILEKHMIEDIPSLAIESEKASVKISEALEKIENDFERTLDPSINRFSKNFNTKIFSDREKRNNTSFNPTSITVPFSLQLINDENDKNQKVEFDKKLKKVVLKNDQDGSAKTLNYKGITRYTGKDAENKELYGPKLIINESKTDLTISLPKVPELLEVSELELSPLYKHSLSVQKSKTS